MKIQIEIESVKNEMDGILGGVSIISSIISVFRHQGYTIIASFYRLTFVNEDNFSSSPIWDVVGMGRIRASED